MMFEAVTIAGVDNTIGMPIYLLPLTEAGDQTASVDATTEGEITVSNMPGFELSIPAGSATFGDGSTTGTISVTQVHRDKVPMPPPGGLAPKMVFTIQPPDVVFDPPAPITYPNAEGHPPGAIVELFSFDHDLGQFVSIGTGQVSEDGLLIESDPGVGIIKGGWHYPAPEPTKDTCSGTDVPCDDPDPTDCLDISGSFNACLFGGSCDVDPRPACASCGEGGTKVCDANVQCVTPRITLIPQALGLKITHRNTLPIEPGVAVSVVVEKEEKELQVNIDPTCVVASLANSNPNVASVSEALVVNGETVTVTAKSKGTTKITATALDGDAQSNSVTVAVQTEFRYTCELSLLAEIILPPLKECEACQNAQVGFCGSILDNVEAALACEAHRRGALGVCSGLGGDDDNYPEFIFFCP